MYIQRPQSEIGGKDCRILSSLDTSSQSQDNEVLKVDVPVMFLLAARLISTPLLASAASLT